MPAPLALSARRVSHRRPQRLALRDGRTIALPAVMGILNVTPDSFSDGGRFLEPERALAHALAMAAAGAGIIDVGGESTRPGGARAVSVEEELKRVEPVLELLERHLRVPVSIDTRKAAVAELALRHGAAVINDISALRADPAMAPLARRSGATVVLMHMRGTPQDHPRHARYHDIVGEVRAFLCARARSAEQMGIGRRRIVVDPGLGFAKTAHHNLALLGSLHRICAIGYPVLIGASRKRFVRQIAGAAPGAMEAGDAALAALALAGGASLIRAHDAGQAAAAIKMTAALVRGRP